MLSIVIPSYKSAHILRNQIPGLKNYLDEHQISHEIILVDDGSNDDGETRRVAEQFGCVFIENIKNEGKGAAVRKGVLAAKGTSVLFTDADIPFDYKAIELFLHYVGFKEFDLVVGDRTLPESNYYAEMPFFRKIASAVFTFFVGRFVITGFFDSQCGFKGFKAGIAKEIFSKSRINGFAFDVEVLYISLKRNYDIKRIPVQLRSQDGQSVSLLFHGSGMLFDLFRIKWNHIRGFYK